MSDVLNGVSSVGAAAATLGSLRMRAMLFIDLNSLNKDVSKVQLQMVLATLLSRKVVGDTHVFYVHLCRRRWCPVSGSLFGVGALPSNGGWPSHIFLLPAKVMTGGPLKVQLFLYHPLL
jgi:hypothetical protein